MNNFTSAALSLLVAMAACESEAPPPVPAPADAPAPDAPPARHDLGAPPEAFAMDKLGPPPTDVPGFVGQSPAPSGAGADFRRARALELLAGGDIAKDLPERAHDPDVAFDKNRVDAMAPPARNSTPRVLLSKPTVKGSLNVEVVRRILRRHLHEVRQCYQTQLKTEPQAKGTTSLSWTVNAKGKVESAEIAKTSFADQALPKCMVAALKTWSFPAPTDGDANKIEVRYALVPPDR